MVTRTITELGGKEVFFLASMAERRRGFVTVDEARAFWAGEERAREALSRLEAKGWLERLHHGKYMIIPLEAGLDRQWAEDALAVGTFIAPEGAAAYWSAVRYWNWTTQLPSVFTFLVPGQMRKSRRTILGVSYRFVRVEPDRFFGVHNAREGELEVRVTDPERTVVDALDRPDLTGGIAEVASVVEAAWPELDRERLTDYMAQFGSGTVPKRLGFLAEALNLTGDDEPWLPRWRNMVATGVTLLERGGSNAGPIVTRWGLRINSPGFIATGDDSA